MPKRLTDKEKEYITRRLKEEARKCMLTFGIKKTTVDELIKRVNIPKGTFYLFYESKELLLFDAINDMHDEVQNTLLTELTKLSDDLTVEKLTDFFVNIFEEVNDILSIMIDKDLDLLIRKLPEDKVKEHLTKDDLSIEKLFETLPLKEGKDLAAFSGAFRGIFMTLLNKREIGEEIFENALRLMIRGLIIQILEDE